MPRAKKQQDPDESIEVVSEEQRVRKSPRRKNPTEKVTKPVKKETKKPGPKKGDPKKHPKINMACLKYCRLKRFLCP